MGIGKVKRLLGAYAMKILAKRSYSEAEFRVKLLKRGALYIEKFKELEEVDLESLVEYIVGEMKRIKAIDDAAYTEMRIRGEIAKKPQGVELIKKKLKLKGIEGELVGLKLLEMGVDEYDLAKRALEKKLLSKRVVGKMDVKQQNKLVMFLRGRGFGFEVIYKALREVGGGG